MEDGDIYCTKGNISRDIKPFLRRGGCAGSEAESKGSGTAEKSGNKPGGRKTANALEKREACMRMNKEPGSLN